MSSDPHTQATGTRGGASAARGGKDREERITTLDPTPASPNADPGAMKNVPMTSSEVVGSAVRDAPEVAPEDKPKAQWFRYTGAQARKFKQTSGDGRDGYTATMQPGKVLCTKDYSLPQLKSQGFLPGRNLEEISEEEAKAS